MASKNDLALVLYTKDDDYLLKADGTEAPLALDERTRILMGVMEVLQANNFAPTEIAAALQRVTERNLALRAIDANQQPPLTTPQALEHLANAILRHLDNAYAPMAAAHEDGRRVVENTCTIFGAVTNLNEIAPSQKARWQYGAGISREDLASIGGDTAIAQDIRRFFALSVTALRTAPPKDRDLLLIAVRIVSDAWEIIGDDLCEALAGASA